MKVLRVFGVMLVFVVLLLSSPNFIKPGKVRSKDIKVDGLLNDEIWQDVKEYSEFYTFQPIYGEPMSKPTHAYTAYDKDNLYFAFKCIDPNPEDIIASLTKRDNMFSEDWVMVMLDSYNDQESCYEFGVNPYGVQGDLVFSGNGDDSSHDFVWQSAAKITDDGYTVEIAIPLKSIRFKPADEVEMGICFLRYSPKASEKGSFPKFDPEGGALLNQFTKITYENLDYNRTVEVLPSVTQNLQYSNQEGDFNRDFNRNEIGVTAKMGLTPTLMLDATYNPDFSQIEADAGRVTKNLRTSVYYREKRPFFLEGSEKFDLAGTRFFSSIRKAVHTRNIIDPLASLKLSGKLGENGSLSSLIAIDESPKSDEDLVNKNAYHGIFRYKNLLKNSSYIGGLYSAKSLGNDLFNSLATDYKYQINGKHSTMGNVIYTQTREDNESDNAHSMDLEYMYSDKKYTTHISLHDISKNFSLPSGFVGRDGLTTLSGFLFRNYYPEHSFVQRFQLGLLGSVRRDQYDNKNEFFAELKHETHLNNSTFLMNWVELATEVYEDNIYRNDDVGMYIRSQYFDNLEFSITQTYGYATWYDEDDPSQSIRTTTNIEVEYKPSSKFQSDFSFMRYDYKHADTKENLMDYQIYRNRTTYQINKYLFLRSTIEYNAYEKQLLTDYLVSFTYIPGTVIHVGYGSMYEKTQWDENQRDYIKAQEFLTMDRGLFMKASYNWRF